MSTDTTDPTESAPRPRPQRPRRPPPRPGAHRGTRLLLWITAIGLVVMVAGTVAAVLLTQGGGGPLADNEGRWLYVDVASLSDSPGTPGLFDDPSDLPPLTTELTALLRDAAVDPEVPGLVVAVGAGGIGWAQTQEVRDALLEFREAGKPCIAWAEDYGNREYYLATACSEIHVAPTGLVLPNGLALTQTYFAGALEKLDAHPNFEHVGDFKSAVEPYERTGPSEFASEATELLLDGLYDQLVAGIAGGRGVDVDQARSWIEAPPMTAQAARERGMVDRLSFKDQLRDQVELHGGAVPAEPAAAGEEAVVPGDGAETEDARKELRHYRDYLKDKRKEWRKKHEVRVAVIYAEGTIMPGESQTDLFGGRSIGDRTLRQQLQQVREDPDIDAVVLRVNSPGGSGGASDAIWREVVLTRDEKPVVVSMSDYAASGGYYISMAADHIVAEPGTLTGSIGVFGGKLNYSGTMARLGLSQHTWERGGHATLLSGVHDFDEADRELFRLYLQTFYDTFITKAAEGRGMSTADLHAVAQGRVWTGAQALERGLVDELGGLEVAIERAVERLELAEAPTALTVVRIPEQKGLLDQLLEDLEQGDRSIGSQLQAQWAADGALLVELARRDPHLGRALSGALHLQQLAATGEVAAMLPGLLDVR